MKSFRPASVWVQLVIGGFDDRSTIPRKQRLQSNGNRSDHGWGSHHFTIGGAVNGGRFYRVAPQIAVNTLDQVGFGRLLPTIAVDQYAATLTTWFGVAPSELVSIAPNIGRFAASNLGFVQ